MDIEPMMMLMMMNYVETLPNVRYKRLEFYPYQGIAYNSQSAFSQNTMHNGATSVL